MGKEFKVSVAGVAVTVETPKEAQKLLAEAGTKASLKDIMSGKAKGVEVVEAPKAKAEDTKEAATGEAANEVVTEETPADDKGQESEQPQEDLQEVEEPSESGSEQQEEDPEGDKEETPKNSTPPASDDIEFPEIGYFADVKAMKRYTKKLTDDQLKEWCELEGATWKPNDHESINRMRMAMAIKAIHFPDTAPKGGSKTKSKYAQYETEQLVAMAMENDIEVTGDNGDMKILRMRTIMALRAAGIIE